MAKWRRLPIFRILQAEENTMSFFLNIRCFASKKTRMMDNNVTANPTIANSSYANEINPNKNNYDDEILEPIHLIEADSLPKDINPRLQNFLIHYSQQAYKLQKAQYQLQYHVFHNKSNLPYDILGPKLETITHQNLKKLIHFTKILVKEAIAFDKKRKENKAKEAQLEGSEKSDDRDIKHEHLECKERDKMVEENLIIFYEDFEKHKCKNPKKVERCDDDRDIIQDKPVSISQEDKEVMLKSIHIDPDGYAVVYTDGSAIFNGWKNAKAGLGVWFGPQHPLNVSQPVIGKPTNNNAELQAAIKAIQQAKRIGIKKLRIYSDSMYVVKAVNEWLSKWKKNNWINSANESVKNKDKFVQLDKLICSMESTDWLHVKAHKSGGIGNNMADGLAKEGMARYKIVQNP